jgi:mono/diheme cytochrome c family protein
LNPRTQKFTASIAATFLVLFLLTLSQAQTSTFHNAPASSKNLSNPFTGQPKAAEAGAKIFAQTCAKCHGENGHGTGNIPALTEGPTQSATDGELFWFITKGDINNGMPSWKSLPKPQRWQVVSFVKTLPKTPQAQSSAPAMAVSADTTQAPSPPAPFTD